MILHTVICIKNNHAALACTLSRVPGARHVCVCACSLDEGKFCFLSHLHRKLCLVHVYIDARIDASRNHDHPVTISRYLTTTFMTRDTSILLAIYHVAYLLVLQGLCEYNACLCSSEMPRCWPDAGRNIPQGRREIVCG